MAASGFISGWPWQEQLRADPFQDSPVFGVLSSDQSAAV